ncbi:regulator of sigma E protease [Clostridiales Family XIII bacterium PM5-7]
MTIIYAIVLFVILIFPHELGHFVVAKAVGVKVNEFAFGMGPVIWKKQKGETQYSIRLVPVGGFCAMEGENEESDSSRAFNNKPVWAKLAVLVAGSTMNVLIAILTLSIMMGYVGTATTTIENVMDNSPAFEAGLKQGDKIIAIDEADVKSWSDLTEAVGTANGEIAIAFERDGQEAVTKVTPEKNEEGRNVVGITPKSSHNVFTAIKSGCKSTVRMLTTMVDMLGQLFTGKVPASQLAGPVGIVNLVSETNSQGLWYFGTLIAMMSLNLALLNILPFPALDGGRILMVIIRKITGKMISDELEGRIHMVGMMMLFGLMIFATWNDITRLFT